MEEVDNWNNFLQPGTHTYQAFTASLFTRSNLVDICFDIHKQQKIAALALVSHTGVITSSMLVRTYV